MNTLLKTACLAALLTASALGPAHALAQTASVTVTVEDVRDGGLMDIALYDSEAGWDGTGPVASRRIEIENGVATAVFENLEAGEYAVRLYHDENGDDVFNMNVMGIPTEGYGFSNNPFPRFRGARHDEAVFTVEDGESVSQTIELMGGGYW